MAETVKCHECEEEFEVTLNDISFSGTTEGVCCPKCGIRNNISWGVFTRLGGTAPTVEEAKS